ncbi:hypothetical protein CEUSTIGMA_g815.t1 [Chlamydomonas eustigma]|uniref:DRBM domain-containing protein n=1 Tax=Chlamydomonas eustigma TaxID=1157962 RepID=A0A250WRR4_9CHLO|nr:hypothetical protein CEUSTIGMA_g815.t1 [Chlamydomonas eustigma]|eukprot:GAX73362.1 hypothetical protein CEUSTIGMA_g815.t1 [Chlamydomonas eustigma]
MAPSPINQLLELKAKKILRSADNEIVTGRDGSYTCVWTIVVGIDNKTIKGVATHKSKQEAKWASALSALDQMGIKWSEDSAEICSGNFPGDKREDLSSPISVLKELHDKGRFLHPPEYLEGQASELSMNAFTCTCRVLLKKESNRHSEVLEVVMIGRGGNKKEAKREAAAAVLQEVNCHLNSSQPAAHSESVDSVAVLKDQIKSVESILDNMDTFLKIITAKVEQHVVDKVEQHVVDKVEQHVVDKVEQHVVDKVEQHVVDKVEQQQNEPMEDIESQVPLNKVMNSLLTAADSSKSTPAVDITAVLQLGGELDELLSTCIPSLIKVQSVIRSAGLSSAVLDNMAPSRTSIACCAPSHTGALTGATPTSIASSQAVSSFALRHLTHPPLPAAQVSGSDRVIESTSVLKGGLHQHPTGLCNEGKGVETPQGHDMDVSLVPIEDVLKIIGTKPAPIVPVVEDELPVASWRRDLSWSEDVVRSKMALSSTASQGDLHESNTNVYAMMAVSGSTSSTRGPTGVETATELLKLSKVNKAWLDDAVYCSSVNPNVESLAASRLTRSVSGLQEEDRYQCPNSCENNLQQQQGNCIPLPSTPCTCKSCTYVHQSRLAPFLQLAASLVNIQSITIMSTISAEVSLSAKATAATSHPGQDHVPPVGGGCVMSGDARKEAVRVHVDGRGDICSASQQAVCSVDGGITTAVVDSGVDASALRVIPASRSGMRRVVCTGAPCRSADAAVTSAFHELLLDICSHSQWRFS